MLGPLRRRDPHAHFVVAPGARRADRLPLARSLGLDHARARRASGTRIDLTSMIDALLVLVLYVLATFSAPSECGCVARPVRLPHAEGGDELVDAPLVVVSRLGVLVDGAIGARAGEGDGDAPVILDELGALLRAKRDLARELGEPRRGAILFEIDRDVPAVLVKSVVRTAAASGFPNAGFVVVKR